MSYSQRKTFIFKTDVSAKYFGPWRTGSIFKGLVIKKFCSEQWDKKP